MASGIGRELQCADLREIVKRALSPGIGHEVFGVIAEEVMDQSITFVHGSTAQVEVHNGCY
ncbi:hypothetical protein ACFYVR_24535 [Rhodococcus sp. NPDC003318]|uniref:hypothetical protein n=1 Tax=Rhodococcus sp. NPDC003318 TaxID=3364503 RepID=UPI0036BCBB8A